MAARIDIKYIRLLQGKPTVLLFEPKILFGWVRYTSKESGQILVVKIQPCGFLNDNMDDLFLIVYTFC